MNCIEIFAYFVRCNLACSSSCFSGCGFRLSHHGPLYIVLACAGTLFHSVRPVWVGLHAVLEMSLEYPGKLGYPECPLSCYSWDGRDYCAFLAILQSVLIIIAAAVILTYLF